VLGEPEAGIDDDAVGLIPCVVANATLSASLVQHFVDHVVIGRLLIHLTRATPRVHQHDGRLRRATTSPSGGS
jgi:hypothetical protein